MFRWRFCRSRSVADSSRFVVVSLVIEIVDLDRPLNRPWKQEVKKV
jgi:hypothetical protein